MKLILVMPRSYSDDLRPWSMYFDTDDLSSKKTGRPTNKLAIHPHVEYIIMETLLEHPEKTLDEIFNDIYQETGDEYGVSSILKRNGFARLHF